MRLGNLAKFVLTHGAARLHRRQHKSLFRTPLPSPPVPCLDATLDKYLEYAAVVAAGSKLSMAHTVEAVERFRVEGKPFQQAVVQQAKDQINWVTPIWLSEMYLKIRAPLPVNTNPAYVFPRQKFSGIEDQLKYAALMIRGLLDFKHLVDHKEIERELSTGREKVRMCMEQYDRILDCYRMPGKGEDEQIYKRTRAPRRNEHISVMCSNQVACAASESAAGVTASLGAASAGDRDVAFEFWDRNKESLQKMIDALFVVCLDIGDAQFQTQDEHANLIKRGHHLLHGFGSKQFGLNRWYDATIQLVVSSSGESGFCIEHSTAEGIVIVSMAEFAMKFVDNHKHNQLLFLDSKTDLKPQRLVWIVGPDEQTLLQRQTRTFDELADDVDLALLIFDDFGKDFIKRQGVSPDGFAQLALQLAHFKLHRRLVSTYESATHRRFASGRVDNIRANTPEALAWVTAMATNKTTADSKKALFRRAAEKQAKNITGHGIDNHLCALWVAARDRNDARMPDLFTDPMWHELMRFPLSTSQVTTSAWLPRQDCYLCYGAVVNDGYGCSYNMQSDHLIFAPTAFKSCAATNVRAFRDAIRDALREMRSLLLL